MINFIDKIWKKGKSFHIFGRQYPLFSEDVVMLDNRCSLRRLAIKILNIKLIPFFIRLIVILYMTYQMIIER